MPKSQKELLKGVEVGTEATVTLRGKVVSVEMRTSEYSDYNCLTIEPVQDVKVTVRGEIDALAEDD